MLTIVEGGLSHSTGDGEADTDLAESSEKSLRVGHLLSSPATNLVLKPSRF